MTEEEFKNLKWLYLRIKSTLFFGEENSTYVLPLDSPSKRANIQHQLAWLDKEYRDFVINKYENYTKTNIEIENVNNTINLNLHLHSQIIRMECKISTGDGFYRPEIISINVNKAPEVIEALEKLIVQHKKINDNNFEFKENNVC